MSTNITVLPIEILVKVADCLPSVTDILTFRLTHTIFAEAGAESLSNRCRCIYLHPSPTALSRFEAVCNDERFSKKITTLVILGPSDDKYRAEHEWLNHSRLRNNRPWPHFYATASTPSSERTNFSQLQQTSHAMFDQAYEPLIRTICKLPQLSAMGYAGGTDEPGFSPVSRDSIAMWAEASRDISGAFGGPSQPPHLASGTMRWSDAEVFVGLITAIEQHITHIDLRRTFAMKKHMEPSRASFIRANPGRTTHVLGIVGSNVTSLSYQTKSFDSEIYSTLLVRGSPKLTQIRCTISGNVKRLQVDSMFESAACPDLRSIEIDCVNWKPFRLSRDRFTSFLKTCSSALETVALSNVIMHSVLDAGRLRKSIVETIRLLKDMPRLHAVRYRFQRELVYKMHHDHTIAEKVVCKLDVFAAELGVTLDPGGYWDFGDCIH